MKTHTVRRSGSRWAVLVALVLWSSGVAADGGTDGVTNPFFRPASGVASVLVGQLDPARDSQLAGERTGFGLGFVFSGDLAAYDWLGLDLEAHFLYREFDTPLAAPFLGALDNDTAIGTTAVLLGARVHYPSRSAFRAYGVGGLGFFHTTMRVYGSLLGFPGSYEDTDQALDFYYGAGLSYALPSVTLSLDYRRFGFSGSFGKFGISGAALGGDLLALGIGWRF